MSILERDLVQDRNLLTVIDDYEKRLRGLEEAIQIEMPSEIEESRKAFSSAISIYLGLSGLRGFWPLTHVDGSGNYLDLGSNGLTLTNHNNVYIYVGDLSGSAFFTRASSTYLNRADEAAFDIVGTEIYLPDSNKGLTIGAWVFPLTLPSATQILIGKWTDANYQRSYALYINSANKFSMIISGTGIDSYEATASSAVSINAWHFVVGRYMRATPEIDLWVNETEYVTTASIPSALYSSSADFTIGASGDPQYYANGGICFAFLCAAALSDNVIQTIYSQTKGMFF